MNRWTRRSLPALAVGAVLVTAACTPHRPDVTFYGNYTALNVGPAQFCDLDYDAQTVSCPPAMDEDNFALIDLQPGQPLQISIDPATAEGPWQVIYQLAEDGVENAELTASGLMLDGQLSYRVQVRPDQQIINAEVQSNPIQIPGGEDGSEPVYAFTRIWVFSNPSAAAVPAP